jgi:tetratricopeptide (TPR) repeat protein
MGRLEDAASILGQALVAANEEGEIQIGGWAHSHHVAIAELKGEIGSALEHAHRGVDIAEKAGDTHALVFAYACLGAAFGMKQEWGEAVAILERARRVIAEGGSGLNWEAYILAHLAGAYHGVGDFRQAGLVSDAAIDVGRKRSTPVLGMPAYPTRACILRSMKGASAREEIANVLREAAALIDETGAEGWRPFVHEELGALAELSGDAAGRERELREAHRLFIEMGATGHAARVAKVIGT